MKKLVSRNASNVSDTINFYQFICFSGMMVATTINCAHRDPKSWKSWKMSFGQVRPGLNLLLHAGWKSAGFRVGYHILTKKITWKSSHLNPPLGGYKILSKLSLPPNSSPFTNHFSRGNEALPSSFLQRSKVVWKGEANWSGRRRLGRLGRLGGVEGVRKRQDEASHGITIAIENSHRNSGCTH